MKEIGAQISSGVIILAAGVVGVVVMSKLYYPTFLRLYRHVSPGSVPKNQGALRIGILGAARIAPLALITPASRNPDVDIIAVAARNIDAAKKYADKHKIKIVHSNYEQLLQDPNIDAIYNPLPNGLHHEWTIKALKAGKHVLCEKPLAANQKEAEEMCAAAKDNGVILVEAFHHRYHPAIKRLVEIIRSGEIGEIKTVNVKIHIPFFISSKNDIRFNMDLAGGTAMDLGCYAINTIRLIMGKEPKEVESAKATLLRPQIDQRMQASLLFDNSSFASFDVSLRAWKLEQKVKIIGTKGTIEFTGVPLVSIHHNIKVTSPSGTRQEKHYGSLDSTYAYQLSDFVKLVRGQNPAVITSAEDAVLNMKVIDAVYSKAGLQIRGN